MMQFELTLCKRLAAQLASEFRDNTRSLGLFLPRRGEKKELNSANFRASTCQSPTVTFSLCPLNPFPVKMNNILPSEGFHHLAPFLQDKALLERKHLMSGGHLVDGRSWKRKDCKSLVLKH